MLYWLYLIIFSLKILKDDEDEAPYDRTYRDKSDMIVPEPRYGNSLPKYGNKTKADAIQDENPWTRQNAKKANKAESEEEGEEEEEGRNPYSQAKLAQQRKLQKQKENQRNEDRKEPNQSNSDDPPSEHLLKREREEERKRKSEREEQGGRFRSSTVYRTFSCPIRCDLLFIFHFGKYVIH